MGCGKDDDDANTLLCDGILKGGNSCTRACHLYCATPKLKRIPEKKWYCGEGVCNRRAQSRLPAPAPPSTCAKGDDGERGDDGLDGKDGRNGKDGKDGEKGKDGNDGKDSTGATSLEVLREFHRHAEEMQRINATSRSPPMQQ